LSIYTLTQPNERRFQHLDGTHVVGDVGEHDMVLLPRLQKRVGADPENVDTWDWDALGTRFTKIVFGDSTRGAVAAVVVAASDGSVGAAREAFERWAADAWQPFSWLDPES
jgi:hypothetical protein